MKLLFSVAVSLAISAGSSLAQQKSEGSRESGTLRPDNIVNLAAIKAVQKDLGVSDEVASKLTLLRDEYRAAVQKEYQDAGINPRDAGSPRMTAEQQEKLVEITKRLNSQFLLRAKELLSTEQHARLRQISLQNRLNFNSTTALLSPDIAAELMVTEEQKQILNALRLEYSRGLVFGKASDGVREKNMKHREEYNTKAIEVLTAEQKETLNKM